MNNTAFFRILWKEYRSQRAAWIIVAATIAVFNFLLLANHWIEHHEKVPAFFAVGSMLTALYALGSSVTLFATERENETYELLRGLPVGPWTVFLGKTAFAIGSTFAMFGFAWAIALALTGRLPPLSETWTSWCGSPAGSLQSSSSSGASYSRCCRSVPWWRPFLQGRPGRFF